MPLLFDEDYKILDECSLEYEEDKPNRYLIIRDFPLYPGLYCFNNEPLEKVDVLVKIPPNYNTSGNDMFWFYPPLKRTDGTQIPAGFDMKHSITFKEKNFIRWSRHFKADSWKPKTDNIQKILDRIEWALRKPDTKK